jgi:hypothetical protein
MMPLIVLLMPLILIVLLIVLLMPLVVLLMPLVFDLHSFIVFFILAAVWSHVRGASAPASHTEHAPPLRQADADEPAC